jgi:methyl-accepting chemotaxis protein/aerotaxis receptor
VERIGQVGDDARHNGDRAARMQSDTAELASEADNLTRQVVGIVRTAVPEVDRRTDPRVPAKGSATLKLGGTAAQQVRLADTSAGGLGVTGVDGVRPGQRGSIAVPATGTMDVEVRNVRGDRAGLAFVARKADNAAA